MDQQTSPKFSIIVPIYNEELAVVDFFSELNKQLEFKKDNYEVIAVNDGSTDKTSELLSQIKEIRTITHAANQGYGSSLKDGIAQAHGEYVVIIDADGTYPINRIFDLTQLADQYDMVSGVRVGSNRDSRWLYTQKIAKYFLIKIANYVTKSRIPDINCGLRVFKKETVLKFWNLYPEGFSFTVTSLVAFLAQGYKVKFIPIEYNVRKGKSTLRPIKSFTSFINLILKITLFFKPLRVFLPLGFIIFLLALAVGSYGLIWQNTFYDTTIILLFATALQTVFFGFLAELIVNNRK